MKTFAVEERWVGRECGDGGGGSCIDGATSACMKLPLDRGVVAVQDMVSDVSDRKQAPINLAQRENDFEMYKHERVIGTRCRARSACNKPCFSFS